MYGITSAFQVNSQELFTLPAAFRTSLSPAHRCTGGAFPSRPPEHNTFLFVIVHTHRVNLSCPPARPFSSREFAHTRSLAFQLDSIHATP